jgi:DNA-binding beta-propeller fold protein YncE
MDIAADDTISPILRVATLAVSISRMRRGQMWPSPGGSQSQPYGTAITPDGMVWYSESGVKPNTLIRFNPKTQEFDSATIPSGRGHRTQHGRHSRRPHPLRLQRPQQSGRRRSRSLTDVRQMGHFLA